MARTSLQLLAVPLLTITLSAIPISRTFQWWSPSSNLILLGGYSALFFLPLLFKSAATVLRSKYFISHHLVHIAMFFCPFMFASCIDLVTSLENDGFIANYMSFYLKKGEPYLATPYNTAICYWDGIVHYLLYWKMINDFENSNACQRSVGLYWFGTFFTSMIVLMLGSLAGPFPVHAPILLNAPYVILPVVYLGWILYSTKHHKKETVEFSSDKLGVVVRSLFSVYFVFSIVLAVARGLIALGADREILNYYGSVIEQPIKHSHTYPRVTIILYLFYAVPFYLYALYSLISNAKTLLLVDLSMLQAGLAANAQVGYIGPYLIGVPDDSLTFISSTARSIFWLTNLLLFVVPHVFALYCYYCYPVEEMEVHNARVQIYSTGVTTRARSRQKLN